MITGFNTNIEHQGQIYHVQTESEGTTFVIVSTFLFKDGAALLSRKTQYLLAAAGQTSDDTIRDWMKDQHKKVLKDLVAGKVPLPRIQ
ncbi:MAG: hypothetical protein AAB035_02440 [Nitrospirota bacterium]